MAHLRRHATTGIVSPHSGAAAAALRSRAAAWEIPVEEAPGQLTLWLWGCELRLADQAGILRLDLSGPERRLVDTLRDTASEVMAEAGLSVAWDRVDAGALAPGLSLARVESVHDRSPGFIRLRLAGDDLGRFGAQASSIHFRLLLPPPGRAAVWPRVAPTGRTVWPEGADALHRAVYTVADYGGAEPWIDVDVFRHSGSPICDRLADGPVGQTVGVLGPGGGSCPKAAKLWFYGDETALPAIARMLPMAPGAARAVLRAAPCDIGALADDPRVSRCDDLLDALLTRTPPVQEDAHIWFAGRADQARAARAHLLAQGWSKTALTCAAYWDERPASAV